MVSSFGSYPKDCGFKSRPRNQTTGSDTVSDMLLPKYSFSDITVYMRTKDGKYLNLTDYEIAFKENERTAYKSKSKFIIVFCSFFYNAYKKRGIKPHICDITLTELLELAGIHDERFAKKYDDVDNGEELLAMFCAKKIMNYRLGKIVKTNDKDKLYAFYRQAYQADEGKNKKIKRLVFVKKFYEA